MYRATEYEMQNKPGVSVSIRVDPESAGTTFFEVGQDNETIVVTFECLRELFEAATLLMGKK
jgi:hypothetical protein